MKKMSRFIAREKLSKKARRELDSQRRTLWDVPPVTKKIESEKLYNRKKSAQARWDDSGMSALILG